MQVLRVLRKSLVSGGIHPDPEAYHLRVGRRIQSSGDFFEGN